MCMKIAFILLLILVFIVLSLKKLNIVSLFFLLSMLLFIVYLDSVFPLLRFELKGDEVISINLNDEYKEHGYVVYGFDKYNVFINNRVDTSRIGVYNVDYILNYGRKKIIKTRKVIVVDRVKPVIELKGDDELFIKEGYKYDELGYTATDNYDGDITYLVKTSSNLKDEVGKYKIVYSVSDSSGNVSSITRIVNVIRNNNGVVYLTFDDGPSEITEEILKVLKKENVKATFFVLNYTYQYNNVIKKIVEEGHSIGLHSYSHQYDNIYSSVYSFYDDLNKIKNKVKKTTNLDVKIIRFPGGSSNTVSKFNKGIMSYLTRDVVSNGYHYFDWNVDSGDAWNARNSYEVYNNVIYNLSMNRSNVVLMHDFSGNYKTLNALDDIIRTAKNNGYVFDKITYNTPMIVHSVNN